MRISLGAVALTALVGGCAIVPPEPAKEHGRRLVWQEEFDGKSFAETKFRFRATMNSNDCLYSNVVETAEVKDGKLCLHVLPSPDPKKFCMLARHRDARHDGLQVRLSRDAREGAVQARCLAELLDDRAVEAQEVPVDERGRHLRGVFEHEYGRLEPPQVGAGFRHEEIRARDASWRRGSNGRTRSYAFPNAETLNDEFHVYGFEWTPKEMSFYVDGKKYTSYPIDEASDYAPNKHVPGMAGHHDFHSVIFNNEVFTPGHGWCPEPWTLKPEDLPIHYEIDWVRLWQDPTKEELKVF